MLEWISSPVTDIEARGADHDWLTGWGNLQRYSRFIILEKEKCLLL